jgi:hypothetical protein
MTTTETARELIIFAGGPSVIAISAVLAYLVRTLTGRDRIPRKGWLALGAGCFVLVWIGLFLVLAAPMAWGSWGGSGPLDPILVFLTATWIIAAGLFVGLIVKSRIVFRYLAESYPVGEGPWLVRVFSRSTQG